MEKVKLGKYQHYKGGLYKVIALGKIEATLEDAVIYIPLAESKRIHTSTARVIKLGEVYETLYDNPLGKVWVRPVTNFTETVIIEGKEIPRFKYLGDKRKVGK